MGNCKDCKWWRPWVDFIKDWQGSGTCYNSKAADLANQQAALLSSDDPDYEPWEPLAAFGCIMFTAKDKELA